MSKRNDKEPGEPTYADILRAFGLDRPPEETPPEVKPPPAEPTIDEIRAALRIGQKPPSPPRRPPIIDVAAISARLEASQTDHRPSDDPEASPAPETAATDVESDTVAPSPDPAGSSPRPLTPDELARLMGGLHAAEAVPPPPPVGPSIVDAMVRAWADLWQVFNAPVPAPTVTPDPEPDPPPPAPPPPPPPVTGHLIEGQRAAATPGTATLTLLERKPKPLMDLGTVNAEVAVLSAMVADFPHLPEMMPFAEYVYTVKNQQRLKREFQKQEEAYEEGEYYSYEHHFSVYQKYYFAKHRAAMADDTPDGAGWRKYLEKRHRALVAETLYEGDQRSAFPEVGRRRHTLIFGPSEWGKSELIKSLLHHYAQEHFAAVIVLDPGGDLVKDLMLWPELVRSNRLRLIQPDLEDGFNGYTVGMNPFDVPGLDYETRRKVATDWAKTLGEISNDLTPNMQLIVTMCVQALLDVPGGVTLDDLVKLLMPRQKGPRGSREKLPPKDERAAELLDHACRHPVARVAEFFQNQYDDESISTTRNALMRRMEAVLNYPYADTMLTGRATLNLEREIEAKRFILLDLSRFGDVGKAVIGKLILGQVAAIGRRRERERREDRTPTHVVIDEAQTMVSPRMLEVLKELRKFGVFLTLAQQVPGDEMAPADKTSLKTNTGCKFSASASVAEKWFDAFPEEMAQTILLPGQFFVQWATPRNATKIPVQVLTVRSDLADQRHRVSPVEWRAYLAAITGAGGYYRPFEMRMTDGEADELPPLSDGGPPPEKRAARAGKHQVKRRSNGRPTPALGDDVADELQDRFRTDSGRRGNW